MNISPEMKKFLESNIDLIENNGFDKLLAKANVAFDISIYRELIQILKRASIDVLSYSYAIPYHYFAYDKIRKIKIPSNIKIIGSEAFAYCTDLEIIYLPKNLTDIKYNAFFDCFSLHDVYYKGTKNQWKKININTSNIAIFEAEIHCTDGDAQYYQADDSEWIIY